MTGNIGGEFNGSSKNSDFTYLNLKTGEMLESRNGHMIDPLEDAILALTRKPAIVFVIAPVPTQICYTKLICFKHSACVIAPVPTQICYTFLFRNE